MWWFALSDNEIKWNKWKLLECLFIAKLWNWLGYTLWEEIKKHNIVFAYTKQEDFFKKIWFDKVEWEQSKSWASLFVYKNIGFSVDEILCWWKVGF